MSDVILTQRDVKELFDYDPETGVCIRKKRTAQAHKAGVHIGGLGSLRYHEVIVNGQGYKLHRLIWLWYFGQWPDGDIDHINRDRADNRISNLRVVDRFENGHNRSKSTNNWSGHTGVYWDKSRAKWRASIGAYGVTHHLGRFNTITLAAKAYQEAKRVYHPTAP